METYPITKKTQFNYCCNCGDEFPKKVIGIDEISF